MEARVDTGVEIVRHAWTKGRKINTTILELFPSEVSLGRAGVEQLYQVKPMIRGNGKVPCSTYSQTF